ncbi:MAG: HD domain-containing protein, partial [Candidatus Paceibacterota bacterium]
MEIKNLPAKYLDLWNRCLPLLQKGRPGDDKHAVEVAEFVLNCGKKDLDLDILIPTAIMHDIGHSAILPEHFKYITGQERVMNGKLVHMLAGAKIAKDTLDSIGYDSKKIAEIVDIISIHDADQLEKTDIAKVFDTENKRIFHDIDCMDRYNAERLKKMIKLLPDKSKMLSMLEEGLKGFFY